MVRLERSEKNWITRFLNSYLKARGEEAQLKWIVLERYIKGLRRKYGGRPESDSDLIITQEFLAIRCPHCEKKFHIVLEFKGVKA